jgi:hypothetical protein
MRAAMAFAATASTTLGSGLFAQSVALDDAMQPITDSRPQASARQVTSDQLAEAQPATPRSIAERLAAMTPAERANALIDLESLRSASPADRLAGAAAAAKWNEGDWELALADLTGLEDQNSSAFGISWIVPPEVEGGIAGFGDVTINAEDATGDIALDVNKANGNLYCVVQVADGWNLYRSANGGITWTNPYSWFGAAGVQDVDMTVVDGQVYVGYVAQGDGNGDLSDFRVRRASASAGAIDAAYGFLIAYDASPSTIEEVALASNAEDFDNRIYLFSVKSNSTASFHWAVAATGAVWTNSSPAFLNVASGIDATWNADYTDHYLFFSYIGTDTTVRVARYDGTAWTGSIVEATYDGIIARTAISAWEDTVITAYLDDQTNGTGVRYRITYNAGGSWSLGDPYVVPAGGDNATNFDVCARGGFGTACVYELEVGEPDQIFFRKRGGYQSGLWDAAVQINNDDVLTSSVRELEMNWVATIDGSSNNFRFGIVYPQPDPTFDRRQHCDGDVDGSGVVNADDVVAVILAWGACVGCPPSCTADIYPFSGDCSVDSDDLVEVILSWGSCP